VEPSERATASLAAFEDAPAVVSLPPRRVVTACGHRPSRRGHGRSIWCSDFKMNKSRHHAGNQSRSPPGPVPGKCVHAHEESALAEGTAS
jgi:hypothetical protein